jgi:hypothetical protein
VSASDGYGLGVDRLSTKLRFGVALGKYGHIKLETVFEVFAMALFGCGVGALGVWWFKPAL